MNHNLSNSKNKGASVDKSALVAFASYYKPHLRLFILDMFCALMIALFDVLFPVATRKILYSYIPNEALTSFVYIVLLLICGLILRTICQWIVTYLGHYMGVQIEADMRNRLFTHMETLGFSFYDKHRTGQLMSRVTNDLFDIAELSHHGPEDLFISIITMLGAFIVLFRIYYPLALILLIAVPFILIFITINRRVMINTSSDVKRKIAGINTEIETSLSGIRTAKAFGNEDLEIRRFEHSTGEYVSAKRKYYRVMARFMFGTEFMLTFMSLIVICFGSFFIMKGRMDIATLITFYMYVASIQSPIRRLTNFTELFTQGMAGFLRFLDILAKKPDIVDAPDAISLLSPKGDIQFDNVSFSYDEGNRTILSHLNLHIKSGQMLALVGPSGSGKTTLCQLIPRFYEVNSGHILLDGNDISHIKLADLRANIGIVQQDVFLFAGTILDNIRYGRPNASIEDVIAAAKLAEIHDDILSMPSGYETEVGERGVRLSGGQKQRISIARIFLKNPKILILDEATSSLDTATEHRIQSAFTRLFKGRTCLVIAHRLSTIRNADEIIVIDEHGIQESGSHNELLQKNGIYAELIRNS